MDRFNTASQLLSNALDQYLHACLDIQTNCARDSVFNAGNSESFATRLTNELGLFNSYLEKISRAQSAVARSRNQMLSVVPIHRLPAEILMTIFRMVVHWGETLASATQRLHEPKAAFRQYPNLLSRVCFRWRAITVACPELWTRITFSWLPQDQQLSITRASTHLNWAGQLPLEIHHVISGEFQDGLPDDWIESISSATSRARSIEIGLDAGTGIGYVVSTTAFASTTILGLCLHSATPGILEHVAIEVKNSHIFPAGHGLLEPPGTVGPNHSLSTIFHNQETYWQSVSVLVLQGFYPYWASPAYQGLVELRLGPALGTSITISELQLSAILASSPRLELLDFKIPITGQSSAHSTAVPVRLNNLKLVNTATLGLLRLLAPGSRALSLFIIKEVNRPISTAEVKSFVARTNIIELYVYQWDNYADIMEILSKTPYIQTLGLSHCARFVHLALPLTNIYVNTLILVSNPSLCLRSLTDFVRKLRVQKLTLSNNQGIYMDGILIHNGVSNVVHNAVGFEHLLGVCPSVQILSDVAALV